MLNFKFRHGFSVFRVLAAFHCCSSSLVRVVWFAGRKSFDYLPFPSIINKKKKPYLSKICNFLVRIKDSVLRSFYSLRGFFFLIQDRFCSHIWACAIITFILNVVDSFSFLEGFFGVYLCFFSLWNCFLSDFLFIVLIYSWFFW